MSAVSMISLTANGRPCTGPRSDARSPLARLGQRVFGIQMDPGLHVGLPLLDPLQAGPGQLLGGDLAPVDAFHGFAGGKSAQFVHR